MVDDVRRTYPGAVVEAPDAVECEEIEAELAVVVAAIEEVAPPEVVATEEAEPAEVADPAVVLATEVSLLET